MTPQEIVDYKRRWMGTARHETKIHSDYHRATRTWLKDHVPNISIMYKSGQTYMNQQ